MDDICGILYYSTSGHTRPCGNTIGANGAGRFCIVYSGDPAGAEDKAREHIKILEVNGYTIDYAGYVPNQDSAGFYGSPVRFEHIAPAASGEE